jgi:16S rRNA (cytosine1402-N4)-methyltransferase
MIAERPHIPVMVSEVVHWLAPESNGTYVDVTLGGGGHAEEILRRSSPGGTLIGMDRDGEIVMKARAALAEFGERARFIRSTFDRVEDAVRECGLDAVDGILADLGVSSLQLDEGDRGFSFMKEGPLDMRMDRSVGESAAEFVSRADEAELADVIYRYGEERFSRRIARAICKARKERPVDTTGALADIVSRAVPSKRGRIHPATRTFQALRIAVNDEIGMLDRFLESAFGLLKPGGRLVVISYHSLEDRLVKNAFRERARAEGKVLTKKVIVPRDEEVEKNPRSRSAKLRAYER